MKHQLYLSFSLLFFLHTLPAAAQVTGINLGDQIRLDASAISSNRLSGTVTDISADRVRISYGVSSLDIPWSSIDNMYLRHAKRNTALGGLVGFAAGGLIVGLAGVVSYRECNEEEKLFACFFYPSSRWDAFQWGALLGGTAGGVVGIIIGYKHKSYRWEKIPLEFSMDWAPDYTNEFAFAPVVTLKFSLGR